MTFIPANVFVPSVTRMPIAGPKPYNTLVCCGCVGAASIAGNIGSLTRGQTVLGTDFVLQGFDQLVPPQFEYSTTAFLSQVGQGKPSTWLYAVDAITGAGFDPVTGAFYVTMDYAVMYPNIDVPEQIELFVTVTSFVLVYEPPVAPAPAGTRITRTVAAPRPRKFSNMVRLALTPGKKSNH
jgi:hypothetical protein